MINVPLKTRNIFKPCVKLSTKDGDNIAIIKSKNQPNKEHLVAT